MNDCNTLISIVGHFIDPKQVADVQPLGNGLINDTYKVIIQGCEQPKYVLQHINDKVFTDVEMLQRNIETVTDHIRKKYEAAHLPDIDRRVLHFLKADNGKTYVKEAGNRAGKGHRE